MASKDSGKAEKSYFSSASSAIKSINPWNSSRPVTQADAQRHDEPPAILAPRPSGHSATEDHCTTLMYGQSFRSYPPGCPPLSVRWFHAVDVPKRKPQLAKSSKASEADAKHAAQPKKFSAFSIADSRRIEGGYQRLLEVAEDNRSRAGNLPRQRKDNRGIGSLGAAGNRGEKPAGPGPDTLIAVHEDFLFDVNIEQRELCPVYWLGPVYDVRRGTWFYQEGSTLRPCEENLAAQLEEGYLKLKPWVNTERTRSPSPSKSVISVSKDNNTKLHGDDIRKEIKPSQAGAQKMAQSLHNIQLPSYRLFGTYMNNVVTYQDAAIAWLTSENMLSWVTTSVYERFAGGGHLSGVKIIRGYTESKKQKEAVEKNVAVSMNENLAAEEREKELPSEASAPPVSFAVGESETRNQSQRSAVQVEEILQRKSLSALNFKDDDRLKSQSIDQGSEQGVQGDENAESGDDQGRDVDHLILVTHGIGQRLGLRLESVNFVQDINVLRKTLKSVYCNSSDLRALNSELEARPGNCRVQVLPVCWRHKVAFPRPKGEKVEQDLGVATQERFDYPSLEDITVEGVAFARSLISDLALDVLLYQSSYRDEISQIVLEESNRIFHLFKGRNPEFRGKVHLMGHSLGSAILFDILCQQKDSLLPKSAKQPLHIWQYYANPASEKKDQDGQEQSLSFDVDNFYCLGSPIGLFQMIQGRTIAGRCITRDLALDRCSHREDVRLGSLSTVTRPALNPAAPFSSSSSSCLSSPAVKQLFNIFHPSDPISYRLEPLVSPAMSSLKPQPLPYTKKGIFGNVAPQGLSNIGAKVGQSVSGLWSSLSAGITNNLLRSSLGLSNDEIIEMARQQTELKHGAEAAADTAEVLNATTSSESGDEKRHAAENIGGAHSIEPVFTNEFETLCSKSEKRRKALEKQGETEKSFEENRKARVLRVEEDKVRALNRHGRIDYSIQESALDFNPINAIASHMSYWADEDVGHFILSQLLAKELTSEGR